MAKSRCVPTALMLDPDYMELASDTQVILLMLILSADDEGRGQAHLGMMSRHFNKSPETIEGALATLAELELVTCYVVGRHRYYSLLRWSEWQTLSKPTPSRFPQPPAFCESESSVTVAPRETQETPGEYRPEGEGEEEGNRREQNLEAKEKDADLPPGVMQFPHPPTARASAAVSSMFSSTALSGQTSAHALQPVPSEASTALLQQLATILRVPVSESLTRLAAEYATVGALTLLGQADAAREWIDDLTRNRHGHCMTVGFFRRWLQREQERLAHREAGEASSSAQVPAPYAMQVMKASGQNWQRDPQSRQEPRLPSLMYLAKEDALARGGRG